jgi:hypothetical protein
MNVCTFMLCKMVRLVLMRPYHVFVIAQKCIGIKGYHTYIPDSRGCIALA